KVGGILVENIFRNECLSASVVGIGLNVKAHPFIKNEVPHAGALEDVMPAIGRKQCMESLLRHLDEHLSLINTPDFESRVFKHYRAHCETLGRNVMVHMEGKPCFGYATTINADGSLVINDGIKDHTVYAGDVKFL